MYLTGVDRSWFRTPFLRHNFTIRSQSDIEALRRAGIAMVTVDTGKSLNLEEESEQTSSSSVEETSPTEKPPPAENEDIFADGDQAEAQDQEKSQDQSKNQDQPHTQGRQKNQNQPETQDLTEKQESAEGQPPPDEFYIAEDQAQKPAPSSGPVRRRQAPSLLAQNFATAKRRRIEWIKRADKIFEGTRATEFVAHAEVHQIVDEVIGNVIEQQAASFAVLSLRQPDPTLHEHSLTVCTLSIILGRTLNYPREVLQKLGMGALLHDIGLARLPRNLMKRPKTMEPAQQALYQTHAELGAATLEKSGSPDPRLIAMVKNHHELAAAEPQATEAAAGSAQELTRLVAVIDQYDELVTGQSGLTPMSSNQALTQIYQRYHSHPDWMPIVSSLIRTIGVYPLYSLVALRSGELGIVGAITPGKAHLPLLYICRDEYRNPCVPPISVDLALEPPGGRSIRDICDPVKSGVDIETVLTQVRDE